jgi:hypothetical protein
VEKEVTRGINLNSLLLERLLHNIKIPLFEKGERRSGEKDLERHL